MYDASGVRLHAGKQASVLNMIITELPPDHPVSNSAGGRVGGWAAPAAGSLLRVTTRGRNAWCVLCIACFLAPIVSGSRQALDLGFRCRPRAAGTLKDTLGHTPLQVAVGAVVGVLTGYLTALLYL